MESRSDNETNIKIEIKEEPCWNEEEERAFLFEEIATNTEFKNEGVPDSSNLEMTEDTIATNHEEKLDTETEIKEEPGWPEQTPAILKLELEESSISNTNLHNEIKKPATSCPAEVEFVIGEDGVLEHISGDDTQLTSLVSPQSMEYLPITAQESNPKTAGKGQHKPAIPMTCDVALDKRLSVQMKHFRLLIRQNKLHHVRLRQEEELHALRLKHALELHALALQLQQNKQEHKRELHALALDFKQKLLQQKQEIHAMASQQEQKLRHEQKLQELEKDKLKN